jgi:hypothetical protein
VRRYLICLLILLATSACGEDAGRRQRVELEVPPGYQATFEVMAGGTLHSFGPFVGYYFKPAPGFERLEFVCFNERGFYASDMPLNAKLFEGEAVLTRLPGESSSIPQGGERITPVFFPQAQKAWLKTRPQPVENFRHFHSLHHARGASLWGYWLSHRAQAAFSYDMGGRVGTDSPLYHKAEPGPDLNFAQIIEFDRGRKDGSR